MNIFFTSDQHYGHKNIIQYSGRPFQSSDHMTEELIARHNAVVSPKDLVWHLGDFTLDHRLIPKILPKLNGIHRLVPGNHDKIHPAQRRHYPSWYEGFEVYECEVLYSYGYYLHHMPPLDPDSDGRYPEFRPVLSPGSVLLHGHVHERWKIKEIAGVKCINVGVDQWDYAPVSLEEIGRLL